MTSLISKFWNNFKTQPDIWFFFGFLLTFTLNIRKVLFYFPIQGTFNEYSGIYVYISDIFLTLTLISWFILILCNNTISLSSSLPPTKKPFPQTKLILNRILVGGELWISSSLHKLYILLPAFLVFLFFLSILWSENKSIALYRSIKLLEFYLLYLYMLFQLVPQLFHACPPENYSTPICDKNVPRGTSTNKKQEPISNCSMWNNFGRVEQFSNTPHPNLLLIKEKERNVPRGTFNLFFIIIILLGLFQATIGIIQFFLQKSVGLFWLKESLISSNILGVAKIILNGETYIRAYGLMPHPNVLGGFLLFSIIITLLYKKMFHPVKISNVPRLPRDIKLFHVEQFDILRGGTLEINGASVEQSSVDGTSIITPFSFIRRRVGDEVYTWLFKLISPPYQKFILKLCELIKSVFQKINPFIFNFFWWGGLAIQTLALILTFSKSAIIGLLIAIIYTNVPRGTFHTPFSLIRRRAGDEVYECSTPARNKDVPRLPETKMFHACPKQRCSTWNIFGRVEHFKLFILSTLIILLFTFIIIKPDLDSLFVNSLNERLFYLNVPHGTFSSDPIFGIGTGQSVLSMQKFYPQTLEFWQYQPIHNVFLLILSELGLVGLGLFIWWLWKLLRNTPRPDPLLIKEREQIVPRGTFHTPFSFIRRRAGNEVVESQNEVQNNQHILHNNTIQLSSIIIPRYFTAILLGLVFIMLFDHYIWDIQQGSLLFWLTAGFVAGISRR